MVTQTAALCFLFLLHMVYLTSADLCVPSPCGPNTSCEILDGVPICKCISGFQGSPLVGCRQSVKVATCESDSECTANQACIDFKCQNPCSVRCAQNAECEIRNHQAVCTCPKNYLGNPQFSCKPECRGDLDCPPGRPACSHGICKDPCDGICGAGADCKLRGLTPVCSCPKNKNGDPLVDCGPAVPDLCVPSPCGPNTSCEIVDGVPICKCIAGFQGSPLVGCRQSVKMATCASDSECTANQACVYFKCQNPCSIRCAQNAECEIRNHQAVCTCPKNYLGNPQFSCKPECRGDLDCPPGHPACSHGICKDPCDGVCGAGADCKLRGLTPVCSCPKNKNGDPLVDCGPAVPDLCLPSPCGPNTSCKIVDGVPICKCIPGFQGSPLVGCRQSVKVATCESDSECTANQACIDFKCQNPCSTQCGQNAECEIRNHQAVCTCPKNYLGNPQFSCKPECSSNVDCPPGRPACSQGICTNPCDGVCGAGADCKLRGLTPACSCPKNTYGDPFVDCAPAVQDLCVPNPCGANAYCKTGFAAGNPFQERPVCYCNSGFIGNAISGCQKGECVADSDCPNDEACIKYTCKNLCVGRCGIDAECNTIDHQAVCTCITGFHGDATSQCYHDQGTPGSR